MYVCMYDMWAAMQHALFCDEFAHGLPGLLCSFGRPVGRDVRRGSRGLLQCVVWSWHSAVVLCVCFRC